MADSLFVRAGGRIARLALPVPIDSLFDYALPDELADAALVGCRALVPFSGRSLTGVIVEISHQDEASGSRQRGELAQLQRVLDPEPVLLPGMLSILREAAQQVLCPIGLALATALPAGSAPRMVRQLVVTPRGLRALESEVVRNEAGELLDELRRQPATASSLARRKPPASELASSLVRDGLARWQESERGPSARVRTVRVVSLRPGVDLESACATTLARAVSQAALLRRIAEYGEPETARLSHELPNAPALLRALAARGLVEIRVRAAPRNVLGPPVPRDTRPALTSEQEDALVPLCEAVQARSGDTFLLHGVTGSGKTEVYLRAIETALAQGRQALVLVPEITLTHQIVERLRARFGDHLAVLHSGLRPSERLEQWQRLHRGETPIAVGARSALFAPIENLGVIVIDEEHDAAYKNEEGFRYHARNLATLRARVAGCPVVLGSATPSLETRYAAERGAIRRLTLSRRIGGRPLPAVELVDMTAERAKTARGRKIILTRPLRRAIAETIEQGGQTILFLNRRGFSTQIFCFDCGHAERCVDCDVALVYHAQAHCLRCHYCDYAKAPPDRCGGCGAPETALLGVGTERVEEEVRGQFSGARIGRLDRDTASRRGHAEHVLAQLREGELDILVGTQMVAKGHDFPGVRLVGVIAADLGLHMPDFRAAERTFQLLTQVAGRAGRAGAPGRVIVQSFVPDHYAIRPVVKHDYELFYSEELQHRAALSYPPFGGIAQVMVSAEDEGTGLAAARELASGVQSQATRDGVEILGPSPAALPRLRGRHRFQILLKSKDADALHATARQLASGTSRLPRTVQAVVDVNPVNML